MPETGSRGGPMSHAAFRTASEKSAMVPEDALAALRGRLRGRLVEPSDADYDEVRAVWNGMVDKRPGLIVRCAGVADVIAAVTFARDHDLLVAVRGGATTCRATRSATAVW